MSFYFFAAIFFTCEAPNCKNKEKYPNPEPSSGYKKVDTAYLQLARDKT